MNFTAFFRHILQNEYFFRHQLRITEKLLIRLIIRSYSINLKLARKCAQALAMYLKEFDDTIVYKLLIKMVSKFDKDTYEQAVRNFNVFFFQFIYGDYVYRAK